MAPSVVARLRKHLVTFAWAAKVASSMLGHSGGSDGGLSLDFAGRQAGVGYRTASEFNHALPAARDHDLGRGPTPSTFPGSPRSARTLR